MKTFLSLEKSIFPIDHMSYFLSFSQSLIKVCFTVIWKIFSVRIDTEPRTLLEVETTSLLCADLLCG